MGVEIEYHFTCDFCGDKVSERENWSRYEEIRKPYSPGVTDIYQATWFWLNHNTVACHKHWPELREFLLKRTSDPA